MDPHGDDYGRFEEAMFKVTKLDRQRYARLTNREKQRTRKQASAMRTAANKRMDIRWKDMTSEERVKMR